MLKVKNKSTGEVFTVQKYTLSGGEEPTENVWCIGWYGRHVIGNDCEWVIERDFTNNDLDIILVACNEAICSPNCNIGSLVDIYDLKEKVLDIKIK